MKKESLIIKYEGDENQIALSTLVGTLVHYDALIRQINEIAGEGHNEIDLKVKGLEKGSFTIDIVLVERLIDSLFTSGKEYLSDIIGIVGIIISIYLYRKGKPIKEEVLERIKEIIEESNKKNNTKIELQTIINIYNRQSPRREISKSIELANNDSEVSGIELINNGNAFIEIDKSEFDELIYDDFDKEFVTETTRHIVLPDVRLGIITLSFEKKNNWKFLYEASPSPITMPMQDNALSSLIESGLRFAKGDSIIVDLEVTQEYNQECNMFIPKKYRIAKFIKHIPRPEQNRISFSD